MSECSASAFAARAINVLMAAVDVTCRRHRNQSPSETDSASDATTPRSPPPPEYPLLPVKVDDDETVTDKDLKPKTHARVGNSSRDRMKLEMQHLRDTKEELQRQLDELKRRSPRIAPTCSKDPAALRLATAWEALARGQCEQRYRAEVENVKLRSLLDEQVKIAQTLERILTKRRNAELINDRKVGKRARHKLGRSPIDDPNVINDMNAVLPSLYNQIGTVLNKPCFRDRTEPFREIAAHPSETTGIYVEATEVRLLPFNVEDSAEAIWHSFIAYPLNKCDDYVQDEHHQDTLERDIHVRVQLQRFTGAVDLKFATRRFVEHDRIVFVWVAMMDPTDIPVDGVIIRHTGWICVRPSNVPADGDGITEVAIAQLCVPEFYNLDGADRKRRLGTLTNFIVDSVESQLDLNKQAIDNRLLERALARATIKTQSPAP